MKANKWIVFVFIAILLATLIMAINPAAATVPDKSVSGDVTPAANPDSTDWIPDQKVSATIQDENHPSIATAGDGSLWVAYQQWNTATGVYNIVVSKSTDGGVTWIVNYTQSTGYNLLGPSIAVDPHFNWVYVAYQRDYTTTDHDIHLLMFNGTGWYTVYVDNTSYNDDYSPSIVCEYNYWTANYLYITWERHVNSQDIELVFAKSIDHGATWTESALTSHGTGELTHQPSMTYTYSAAGTRIYIAYRDNDQIEGMYKIGLLTSTNEGASFGTPQDISSFGYTNVREPSITATHGGAVVVAAWIHAYSPTDDDIDYSYSTDNGVTWSAINIMSGQSWNEVSPHLTVDGMGRQDNYLGYIHITFLWQLSVGSRTNGICYKTANYATPTSWSSPLQVADDNAYVPWGDFSTADRAITTVHDSVPVIVWTDGRLADQDIFATTLGGKYTIDTSPTGLQVSVDGAPYTAPQSFYWAYQSSHTLSVTSPQGQYSFVSWSDAGAQSHSITATTLGETTITANFVQTPTYLVVRGADNKIYYRACSSGTWGSWNSLPTGTTMDGPAAAVAANSLYVVVRGSDGASLWFSSLNLMTSSFSGWTLLSGSTPSTPTLSSNGTALALTVRGQDNRIYYRIYTIASQTWTGWSALPSGATQDSPGATMSGNNLYIAVRGSDGTSLWYSNINPTTQVFLGWTHLSGSTPSPPTFTYQSGSPVTLAVRGQDNRIYYTTNGASWNSLPTGTTIDSPAATILQNTLYTVVRGSDGTSLWTSNINLGTSIFSGWTQLSGSTPSKPTLT